MIYILDKLKDMSEWTIHNEIEKIRNQYAREAYEEIYELRKRLEEKESLERI